ncbi:hypothetical protein [uncultured Aquimarina sp.]|uniref:hypothetical protein n=1 Tax=uncultured Aquimarina sp. TaxID=575652 RepID=UPI0026086FD8|nr:hypothetical protein [uncultured Aquimarina sp.]
MRNIPKLDCYLFSLFVSTFIFFSSCKQEVKSEETKKVNTSEVIQDNKVVQTKNEEEQNDLNCFTQKDIKNLSLFFKSITNENTTLDLSGFNFKEEDLSDFKKLFLSDDFNSFVLKYNEDVECDDYIILDIMERIKYEDDGEVHYSERNIMYELTKKGKNINVKSAGIAG